MIINAFVLFTESLNRVKGKRFEKVFLIKIIKKFRKLETFRYICGNIKRGETKYLQISFVQ